MRKDERRWIMNRRLERMAYIASTINAKVGRIMIVRAILAAIFKCQRLTILKSREVSPRKQEIATAEESGHE